MTAKRFTIALSEQDASNSGAKFGLLALALQPSSCWILQGICSPCKAIGNIRGEGQIVAGILCINS